MKFGRRRTEEQKKNNPHPEIDRQPEQGHWFRGFKLTTQQWERLMDKFNKGYSIEKMNNRDIFDDAFTSNLDDVSVFGTVKAETELGWAPSGQMMNGPRYLVTGSGLDWSVPNNYALDVDGSLHLQNPRAHNLEMDVDALWQKMYEHMRKVIVVCKYCERPQTIDNEVCSGCGAPLPVEYL